MGFVWEWGSRRWKAPTCGWYMLGRDDEDDEGDDDGGDDDDYDVFFWIFLKLRLSKSVIGRSKTRKLGIILSDLE